jgi:hypothetical protein
MINNTAWYPYTNTTTVDVAMNQTWTTQNAYNFSADNVVLPVPDSPYAQLVVNSLSNDPHPFHLVPTNLELSNLSTAIHSGSSVRAKDYTTE